jgi:acetamidase/formamidase
VRGANPGDTLVVDVVSLEHRGWGWNGVIPGFGLLGDEFERPYLHHYELDGDVCVFDENIRIPYEPFCGTMGVALDEDGRFDTAPPRRNGENIDIRQLTPGSRLRLPVLHEGARHLVDERGLTREQAYCLSGAAVDLKISEIVDAPNWIVSA